MPATPIELPLPRGRQVILTVQDEKEIPDLKEKTESEGGRLLPSFFQSRDELEVMTELARKASGDLSVPELWRFYRAYPVNDSTEQQAADLADLIRKQFDVKTVLGGGRYDLPPAAHGGVGHHLGEAGVSAMTLGGPGGGPPLDLPHLGAGGVNTLPVAQLAGANGNGIRVAVCDQGWQTNHPGLTGHVSKLSAHGKDLTTGAGHGTMSLGVLKARHPTSGHVTGVCPGATILFASENGGFRSHSIGDAVSFLNEGDVMLLEMQAMVPLPPEQPTLDEVPAEYDPDIRAAVLAAAGKGITVVAAAGNQGVNLADFKDAAGTALWALGAAVDSVAIIVGAGYPDSHRWHSGNYGERVNCQGWGDGVWTTAIGNPSWRTFANTSAASALVAGVVACLQGRNKAVFGRSLPPQEVRELLGEDTNGSKQPEENPLRRIGPLPDLEELFRNTGLQ